MLTISQGSRRQFPLQDILAVMVGYGMAALLFRAFWPQARISLMAVVPAIALYLWLGMAMSGPILLLRRPLKRVLESPESGGPPPPARSRTWAELAWSLIGAYWIVLGFFVIPARLQEFKFGDMLIFGLVPLIVAVALRCFGAQANGVDEPKRAWTHAAAVILVATWPLAWICLIVLGRTLV